MYDFWEIIGLLIATGVGMGCGSYATMPYYRLPNGVPCGGKWTGKRSACPSCGKKLRTRDLFPVLNWLWTRGQCYNCQAMVNPVYFFIEFSCTLISILLFMKFGFDQMYIIAMGLAVCLIIASATQYSYQVIPDALLVVMIMFGFLYRTILDGQIYDMTYTFALAVICGLVFAHFYEKKEGRKIKNFGLLKLFAVTGIWLSTGQFMFYLVAVLLVSIFVIIFDRISGRSTTMVYGGVLSAPFLLIIFFPNLHIAAVKMIQSGGI